MTSKIINDFVSKVDTSRDNYTLDELKKLLAEAFKSAKKKKNTGEKKEPSQYNLFIKEAIQKIRQEDPNVDKKQLMSLAAAKWKDHKATLQTAAPAATS